MMLSAIELAKVMTQHDREELLIALGFHFGQDCSKLKAIAERSKIRRLSGYPAPTDQEKIEAKNNKLMNFVGLYRNRINANSSVPISLRDAKDVYDLIRDNL